MKFLKKYSLIIGSFIILASVLIFFKIEIFSELERFASWAYPTEENRNGKILQLTLNVLAGGAVLFGLYVSHRRARAMELGVEKQSDQIELSRKAQTDERFKNAIEHLGSEKEPIILGGVAELHQIATEDKTKYGEVVFNILTSYIRTSANREIEANRINKTVIQTIINYLFKALNKEKSPYLSLNANLSFTNLNGLNFDHIQLENANLSFCLLPNMENTTLLSCKLTSTNFIMLSFMNVIFSTFTSREQS